MSCTPQGVLKGLNTSFPAAILRDPPETNQMTTKRKEGRFRWKIGSHLFRRMTKAGFSLLGTPILSSRAPVPPSSPSWPLPTPTQSTPPPRPISPLSPMASSHSGMTTLLYNHSGRIPSQDSTSSQRRRDDRDYYPPPPSADPHGQEMDSNPFEFMPRRRVSPQLHKSISMDTQFPQGPRSHSPRIRTSSTILLGQGRHRTGTQVESGLVSGTGQIQADRQERRPLFPSTLQSLLSNDFRCVVRCRAVSHNNCCAIIHRFRILVVGKVCIMYHTGRRQD